MELTIEDYIIICGDFGLCWAKDKTFEYHCKNFAEKPYTILWVQGNHENYDRIVADAQTEAKKIMDNASKNATLEEQKRIEQAQEQIAGLVVEATAKLVAAKQNADSDRELYNQFIAKTGEKID